MQRQQIHVVKSGVDLGSPVRLLPDRLILGLILCSPGRDALCRAWSETIRARQQMPRTLRAFRAQHDNGRFERSPPGGQRNVTHFNAYFSKRAVHSAVDAWIDSFALHPEPPDTARAEPGLVLGLRHADGLCTIQDASGRHLSF